MTKQDVYVDSSTAQSLAAQASSRGKTLYSFTNEILDVALRVFSEGGNENEIFPAWKTSRVSKDIEGAPYLPRTLIWSMVERLYRSDPDWLLEQWLEAGKRLGERLRRFHPTLEDLQVGISGIQSLMAERRLEVKRQRGKDGQAEIQLRLVTDLTPELTACGERLLVGLLSAYSFRPTAIQVAGGTIEITAVYVGKPATDSKGSETIRKPRATRKERTQSRSQKGAFVNR